MHFLGGVNGWTGEQGAGFFVIVLHCIETTNRMRSSIHFQGPSYSVVLFRSVRVTSEITYSILIDCICILILIPTLRSGSPHLLQFDGPGRHHTASIPSHKHLSPQEFFLSFLGSSCSLWCWFFVGFGYFSYSKVLFSLSVLLWHHQGAQGQPVASMPSFLRKLMDKQTEITMFSSTAIALYGYDQGK